MKKQEKKQLVSDLHARLERAQGTFLVENQGLNVETLTRLRTQLRKVDTEIQVVKNRLLKLASKGTPTEQLSSYMQGPSAIALTYEDVIAPAKVLADFARDVDKLKIKAGQVSGRILDFQGVKQLGSLPGREVLLSQVLSAMQGVPASFVRVLSGVIGNLMNVLKAIEKEKAN